MPRCRKSEEAIRPTCGCCGDEVVIDKAVVCRQGCDPAADGCGICGRRRCNVHGCRCRRPKDAAPAPAPWRAGLILWGDYALLAA